MEKNLNIHRKTNSEQIHQKADMMWNDAATNIRNRERKKCDI